MQYVLYFVIHLGHFSPIPTDHSFPFSVATYTCIVQWNTYYTHNNIMDFILYTINCIAYYCIRHCERGFLFQAGVGTLHFPVGARDRYIDITIRDNILPESEKTFFVELINPTGGAEVQVPGSRVTVTIEHSDQAYGVFQFHDRSLSVVVEETGGSGGSVVYLEVGWQGCGVPRVIQHTPKPDINHYNLRIGHQQSYMSKYYYKYNCLPLLHPSLLPHFSFCTLVLLYLPHTQLYTTPTIIYLLSATTPDPTIPSTHLFPASS